MIVIPLIFLKALNLKAMNSQTPKGFYSTYNNPKREAYHEAGHLVALFLLTGDIEAIKTRTNAPRQRFSTLEEYRQIFNAVCYWIAGGVAEKVYCHLKGLPQITMEGDIDTLLMYAKHDWKFPFKQMKNGFPGCPILDNMVKTAVDLIEALFRSSELFTVKNVTNFIVKNGLTGSINPENIKKQPAIKQELLKILNAPDQELLYCLSL